MLKVTDVPVQVVTVDPLVKAGAVGAGVIVTCACTLSTLVHPNALTADT